MNIHPVWLDISSLCSLSTVVQDRYNMSHCLQPLTSGLPVWLNILYCIWAHFARYLVQNTTCHTAFSLWPQASQCGSTYMSSLCSLSSSKYMSSAFNLRPPSPNVAQYIWARCGCYVYSRSKYHLHVLLGHKMGTLLGHPYEKFGGAKQLAPFWSEASFWYKWPFFRFVHKMGTLLGTPIKVWALYVRQHWKRAPHANFGKDWCNGKHKKCFDLSLKWPLFPFAFPFMGLLNNFYLMKNCDTRPSSALFQFWNTTGTSFWHLYV